MIRVYVAGPISRGDVFWNAARGITMGERLLKAGFAPYVPHLTIYWNQLYPHTWEEWLTVDEQWLLACDAVFRLSGESRGAEREEKFATACGIPVFRTLKELKRWAKKKKQKTLWSK